MLVHNAGVWPTRLERNEDGVEQAFAVNHLAPFQLNLALEDRLRRVVQVSAGLYVKGRVDPDRTPAGADFHRMRTYCDTKLANLLVLPLFARRWQDAGVTIDAVHPGVVRTRLGDPGGAARPGAAGGEADVGDAERRRRSGGARWPGSGGTGRYFHLDTEQPLPRDPALAEPVVGAGAGADARCPVSSAAARRPFAGCWTRRSRCTTRRGRTGSPCRRWCRPSGVSLGSLYHHFGSFDGLAAALYERCMAELLDGIVASLERARTARGGVRAVVTAYLRFVEEQPRQARFIHASAYASYLPAHAESIAAMKAPRMARMARVAGAARARRVHCGPAGPADWRCC